MPDHVHLLVEGQTAAADLRRFIKRTKQGTGQAYSHRTSARLWQEGYYEHVLKRDTDVREVARYILWNPVRAGLSMTPAEYPYLGSDTWSVEELLEA